jgi:hypothetical protein
VAKAGLDFIDDGPASIEETTEASMSFEMRSIIR